MLMSAGTFCFGTFRIYAGRNSYVMTECQIRNYFRSLSADVEGALYGSYFLEVMDFVTRENNDETELLILLYQSLRALEAESLDNRLVRAVFEIKTIMLEGEFPMPEDTSRYSEGALYTLQHIGASKVSALYTFKVSDEILTELEEIAGRAMRKSLSHKFVSLDILKAMTGH
jgi:DNA repair protein RecO (recombination protein O)